MALRLVLRGALHVALILGVSGLWAAAPARADSDPATSYPARPVHLVVGFSAGGGNDTFARITAQKMSEILKQPVLVDNKPGAGSIIATDFVAKAKPDGYTLLIGASGAMVINPAVYATLPYDSKRDFVPLTQIAHFPLMLVVSAKSPIKTVADMVAYTKAHPEKSNYASSSVTFQLATELFKLRTGAPMEMVAYKGSGDSVMAVISGEVLCTIADTPPVAGQLTSGQIRGLAVTGDHRLADFPDVPTMAEAGVNDAYFQIWSGIFAPKGTPPGIVAKLQAAAREAITSPEVSDKLKNLAVEPSGMAAEEFGQIIDRDLRTAVEIAHAAHVRVEQ